VKALDDIVNALVLDLSLVQHLSTEFVRRNREDSIKQQKGDRSNSSIRHAKAIHSAGQLRAQLTKVRQDYWTREAAQRKVSVSSSCQITEQHYIVCRCMRCNSATITALTAGTSGTLCCMASVRIPDTVEHTSLDVYQFKCISTNMSLPNWFLLIGLT